MNCKLCSKKLRADNKHGICNARVRAKGLCAPKATCKVCNKILGHQNKGDTCRSHRTQSNYYKAYQSNFRMDNAEAIAQYKEKYRKDNRIEINQYFVDRRKADLQFKLANNLRNRLNKAIKTKQVSAVRDLGCSVAFLKAYLESKFEPGMTWENWTTNGWHIDHIYPLSKADLTNTEELKKVCHYTNLQPMWAKANISKSNRI